jgi:hypothetical protein
MEAAGHMLEEDTFGHQQMYFGDLLNFIHPKKQLTETYTYNKNTFIRY